MSRPIPRRLAHLAAVIAAMLLMPLFATAGPPYDFCTYYTAGTMTAAKAAGEVHDFEAINRAHRGMHPEEQGVRVGTFVYSPLFLLPAAALARLDFATAQVTNQLLILLSLGGLLFLLLERTESIWLRILVWVVFIGADAVSNQFFYQNWSAHLGLLTALAIVATLARRTVAAAVLWALAIHLKAYLGLFLLPLLLAGRRRLAAGVLIAGGALAIVSLPGVGLGGYLGYLDGLRDQAGGWTTYFFNQVSLQSTIARAEFPPSKWASATLPPSLALVEWIFWLSLPLWSWLVWRLRHDLARTLALTIPYLLLFVPKVWDHTQILFFALFVTAALARRTKAVLLAYLVPSWFYFPLVQHLLAEALTGSGSTASIFTILLYYPVLNLLALAAVLAPSGGHTTYQRGGASARDGPELARRAP